MTRHFSTFVLAAILTVAATILISSVFAADYEERVKIDKAEVCAEDSRWNLIAEKVVPEVGQAFEDPNFVVKADMPRTAVGRFFGGAWGTDGFQPFMFGSGNWRLWEVNESVPGWRVDLNKQGLFLHAQKGKQGTAFVFVGAIPADNSQKAAVLTANSLDSWLNKNGEFWEKFNDAVAETTTGHYALQCHNALVKMGVTWGDDNAAILPGERAAAARETKKEGEDKKKAAKGDEKNATQGKASTPQPPPPPDKLRVKMSKDTGFAAWWARLCLGWKISGGVVFCIVAAVLFLEARNWWWGYVDRREASKKAKARRERESDETGGTGEGHLPVPSVDPFAGSDSVEED